MTERLFSFLEGLFSDAILVLGSVIRIWVPRTTILQTNLLPRSFRPTSSIGSCWSSPILRWMDSTSSSLMFRTPHKTTLLLDRSWQWTHPSRLFRVAQPLLPTYVFDVRGAIPSGIQNPLSKNPWPGCIGNSMTTGALGAHLIGSTFPFWRWKISIQIGSAKFVPSYHW